jgi:PAS domain S-box-containing protein/putative nucleotidyltransferase with HDIG domain
MADPRSQILIVDDDAHFRRTFADVLKANGYEPLAVAYGETALDIAARQMPTVAVIDLRLPDTSGLELLGQVKEVSPDTECIVLTGYASQQSAIEAVNLGAYSYVQKPYDLEKLLLSIRRASEKSESNKALRESEERYRLVVESASEGIVLLDLKGTIREVNAKALELSGFDREELVGRNFAQLLPHLRMDAARLLRAFKDVITGGERELSEWTMTNKRGEEITFFAPYSVINKGGRPVGLSVILQDISQRRQAEAHLRESEEKYRVLVEQSLQGMVVAQGVPPRLVFANRAIGEMLGYSVQELLSLPAERIASLIHPEDRGFFFRRYADRLQGKPALPGYEVRGIRKDGSVCWLELHSSPIEYGGHPAVQAVFLDISERKEAERELLKSYETVQETLMGTVNALAAAVEKRDPYTAGHQRRVAELAGAIARELGLPEDRVNGVLMAGLIHDIGKIFIPAEILSKPSKLSEIEMMMIRTHSQAGYDVLSTVDFPWPVADMVLQHHERMNGSGYPRGLIGAQIPQDVRILSVADTADAMASRRPYRAAHSTEQTLEEVMQNRGELYDHDAVDAVLKLVTQDGYKLGSA